MTRDSEPVRPVAIVTGAGRGIGAAIAAEFGRRGYDLVLTDVLADSLNEVAREVSAFGKSVRVLAGDLADMAFAHQVANDAILGYGRVDVLVNNAAWRELVTMRTVSVESWDR